MAAADQLKAVFDESRNGTNSYYSHWFNKRFLYTDGVKEVCDVAQGFWLLDVLATELAPVYVDAWRKGQVTYADVRLSVTATGSAVISATFKDGEAPAWSKYVTYTDWPEGDWKFLLGMNGSDDMPAPTLMLISEW